MPLGKMYLSLSEELQERIKRDRAEGVVNPYAASDDGVIRKESNHDVANLWRPAYVRDAEKIMHIPFYNRYMDKTQVFSLYKNDDVTRRALHVQYVSRIARNIGRMLNLNLDLIEAIALGHDIGHTPFGHAGERQLSQIYQARTGRYFNHNIHSARVLDTIWPLNLSLQTLDGIICHNGEMESQNYKPVPYDSFETFYSKMEMCYTNKNGIESLIPCTLEGCVVRVSDIIAYLGKDRQDAMRLGFIPKDNNFCGDLIGNTNAEIINNMIVNIIENSYGCDHLAMSPEVFDAFSKAKKDNSEQIYKNPEVDKIFKESINPMFEKMYDKLREDVVKGNKSSPIYKHHIDYVVEQTRSYRRLNSYPDSQPDDVVVDYIAAMTDDYFVDLFEFLFPESTLKVKYNGYFE